MRSAADFETPNNGATCRNVRFVRQYVATSAPHQCHQPGELRLDQTRKRLDPLRIIR
jgi:hypothetical protein